MSCVSINVLAIILHLYIYIYALLINISTLAGTDLSPTCVNSHSWRKSMGGNSVFFCKFLNVCFICQKPLLSPVLGPVYIYVLYVCIMHTGSTLNKRTEFFSSCNHKEGLLLRLFLFSTENCVLVLHFDHACLSSAIFWWVRAILTKPLVNKAEVQLTSFTQLYLYIDIFVLL